MYKIQRHRQAGPEVVQVDKLMPYYPDFRERLHSWIETDCPMQYRDQEVQTSKPVLQHQAVAVVDIPPLIPDPAPAPEPAEPHPDAPTWQRSQLEETKPTPPTQNLTCGAGNPVGFDPWPRPRVVHWIGQQPRGRTAPILCPEDVSD